jgi:hypothetical protein
MDAECLLSEELIDRLGSTPAGRQLHQTPNRSRPATGMPKMGIGVATYLAREAGEGDKGMMQSRARRKVPLRCGTSAGTRG